MSNIYGYIYMSAFIETGLTERGAKIAASRAGSFNGKLLQVGYRSSINSMYIQTSVKNGDKWTSS